MPAIWQQTRSWCASAIVPATRAVIDLIAPPRCSFCDILLPPPGNSPLLCEECRSELAPQPVPRCVHCGARSGPYLDPRQRCSLCRKAGLRFDTVFPLGSYEGRLRQAVLRMKRWPEEPLTMVVAELMCRQLGPALAAWKPDAIVPVPMHWRRRLWRGTNSPEILAQRLARELKSKVTMRSLVRRRATLPQGELPPSRRYENMHGAFGLRRAAAFRGLRVLLVDDILTTGATCSEVARVLKRAGVSSVAVAVAARAQGHL